jgi:hypothetical protein
MQNNALDGVFMPSSRLINAFNALSLADHTSASKTVKNALKGFKMIFFSFLKN